MPKIQKPRGLKQKYSAILSFLFDHQRNLESGGYYKTFAKHCVLYLHSGGDDFIFYRATVPKRREFGSTIADFMQSLTHANLASDHLITT